MPPRPGHLLNDEDLRAHHTSINARMMVGSPGAAVRHDASRSFPKRFDLRVLPAFLAVAALVLRLARAERPTAAAWYVMIVQLSP